MYQMYMQEESRIEQQNLSRLTMHYAKEKLSKYCNMLPLNFNFIIFVPLTMASSIRCVRFFTQAVWIFVIHYI